MLLPRLLLVDELEYQPAKDGGQGLCDGRTDWLTFCLFNIIEFSCIQMQFPCYLSILMEAAVEVGTQQQPQSNLNYGSSLTGQTIEDATQRTR